MRFCMVTTFYPPCHFGGDGTYVRALSRALVALGHEVEVVHCVDAFKISGGKEVPDPEPVDDGITIHRLKSPFGPLSPLITQQTGRPGLKSGQLRELLRRDFDVVNFHNISLVGGPGILGFSHAPVTLYTLHEHWLLCPTHIFWKNRDRACNSRTCFSCSLRSGIPPQLWRYSGLLEDAVSNVDLLIAPSDYTARQHRNAGLSAPVTVLPLFSEIEAPKTDTGPVSERPNFLFAGRVTASKGIGPLLEHFAACPQYDLTVIGDGDLLPGLRSAYGQAANIRFLGKVPQHDLIEHYSRARALVFPSLAPETFGLSIVEAFACGTPAIVRDAGGCAETVEATGAGIVYRSADDLQSALARMAEDDASWQDMRHRAQDGYQRLYTRDRHVAAYLDIVYSQLSTGRTPATTPNA